jgi:hypothetical protein
VPLPLPRIGLVISYSYLWHREHIIGQIEGRKDRPCLIVAVETPEEMPGPRVTVAPITHLPPTAGTAAVEFPAAVKRFLGLDDERAWVVIDDLNRFEWPGFDLRPVPGSPDRAAYGLVPLKFLQFVREAIRTLDRRLKITARH